MPPASSSTIDLRKNFPTIYLTLISIVVALAVEGLLERIDQIETLFTPSPGSLLVWVQVGLVLGLAAIFWWVIARWASTLPWDFGYFDALMPLVLLVVFHYLATSVGGSASRWFVAVGLVGIGGAVNYFVSASRAVVQRPDVISPGTILLPTGLGIASGAAFLGFGALIAGRPVGVGIQLALNGVVVISLLGFSITEYRTWVRLTAESPR